MKKLLIVCLVVCLAAPVLAQPNAADPSLRLWLSGTNTGATRAGTDPALAYLDQWSDSSSYGTVIAAGDTYMGATGMGSGASDGYTADPDGHTPQVVAVSNGGQNFNAVNFRGAGPPDATSDRMWQQSNMGATDPTDIGGGTDLTMLMVTRNFGSNFGAPFGPHETIAGKRGVSSSVYSIGREAAANQTELITYAGPVIYTSGQQAEIWPEWSLIEMKITQTATPGVEDLTFTEFYNDGTSSSTTQALAGRNAATGEAFALAFHTQGVNGLWERWAGQLAEVIVYARDVNGAELASLENGLRAQYGIPEPMTMSLLGLGGLALLRRRRA